MRWLLICLILLPTTPLLTGCSARGPIKEQELLPFHVAVLPVETRSSSSLADSSFSLVIENELISQSLCEELQDKSFQRASLLDYPPDSDPETFARKGQAEKNRWWIQQASAIKADVVLVPRLTYQEGIQGESEPWYIVLPSFLFLGPFQVFVKDRVYKGSATLEAQVHDLNPIASSQASLLNQRARVVSTESKFEETKLTFLDRDEGVLSFVPMLVCPTGWLSKNTEAARKSLKQTIVSDLARNLATRISASDRTAILQARESANHYILPESVKVVRKSDSSIDFTGRVLLNPVRGVDRLRDYSIEIGRERYPFRFTAPDIGEGEDPSQALFYYQMEATIPAVEDGELLSTIRVIIREGGAPPRSRSYTFPIALEDEAR